MKIAVVGATGMVGTVMIQVLDERNLPITEFIPVASERSAGKKLSYKGKEYTIVTLADAVKMKPDVALFSAGGDTSLEWAPKFAEVGTTVIDNSSAWRMGQFIPLIVPEINANQLTREHKIIANPNCSTIQLVMVLAPLERQYGLKRVVISTYQSISGNGVKAVEQLENEKAGIKGEMAYPHPINQNCLPHCDEFLDNGYTKEEMKLVNETKKILHDDNILVTATAVRVPVVGGHSESVNIEFLQEYNDTELVHILENAPGIVVQDDPRNNVYPMPINAHQKNETFVGRIRRDFTQNNTVNMWIVADNLRKGAATNAVQIAEYLIENNLVD